MKPLQHGLRILAGTLMGRALYRAEDEHGEIRVSQRGDRRVLSFGSGLEQSNVSMSRPEYLCHEYTRMMLLGVIFTDAHRVAIMGLGGGGLVHCLHHHYPQLAIRVVELRQAVIDVAYEWFDLPRAKQVQVIHGDAMQYMLAVDPGKLDVIFSDLYEAGGMSVVQGHRGYIEACYNALCDNGWLVLNFHTLPDAGDPIRSAVHELFADVRICHAARGNWIMYCGKRRCEFDDDLLQRRARALAEQTRMQLMVYYRQLHRLDHQPTAG